MIKVTFRILNLTINNNRTATLLTLCWMMAISGLSHAEDTAWISMPNGKDLQGWTPYFAKLGLKNPDSTFQYTPEGYFFVNQRQSKATTGFGHLFFTKKKLSYYMARGVYRFTSETTAPGFMPSADQPQNNGFMIHSQDPNTMNGRDFPISAECQLLGPKNALFLRPNQGYPVGTTANLCISGIQVNLNGRDQSSNCHQPTYPESWRNTQIPWEDPNGWSDITIRVLGDSLIQHFVHGVKVIEYSKIRANGSPLKEGYLAIQAEGTSTVFKTLEYVELIGCMDKSSPNYRSYFVKNDPSLCQPTAMKESRHATKPPRLPVRWIRENRSMVLHDPMSLIVSAQDMQGIRQPVRNNSRSFSPANPGLYLVLIKGPEGMQLSKVFWE